MNKAVYLSPAILALLVICNTPRLVLASCDEARLQDASKVSQEAMDTVDDIDRVIMLKRSLKICPSFNAWLELGKTELKLENPFDAAYALENARDFYTTDKNNSKSRDQILRQAIANSWLAETYHLDDELALAVVATQEATKGFDVLGQAIPKRLVELQATIDDELASAESTVLARTLSIQHSRASRGIGVRTRIRDEEESAATQIETTQLLAEYAGETLPLNQLPAGETATSAAEVNESPARVTESRLNIPVLFEFDSDQLSPSSLKTVEQISAAIEALALSEVDSVLIVGHTDAQGSSAYNLSLSTRRAESVLQQITQSTKTPARLIASGRGESELRYFGNSNDDHRRNRRVELIIKR